jgi:hypothetical protein
MPPQPENLDPNEKNIEPGQAGTSPGRLNRQDDALAKIRGAEAFEHLSQKFNAPELMTNGPIIPEGWKEQEGNNVKVVIGPGQNAGILRMETVLDTGVNPDALRNTALVIVDVNPNISTDELKILEQSYGHVSFVRGDGAASLDLLPDHSVDRIEIDNVFCDPKASLDPKNIADAARRVLVPEQGKILVRDTVTPNEHNAINSKQIVDAFTAVGTPELSRDIDDPRLGVLATTKAANSYVIEVKLDPSKATGDDFEAGGKAVPRGDKPPSSPAPQAAQPESGGSAERLSLGEKSFEERREEFSRLNKESGAKSLATQNDRTVTGVRGNTQQDFDTLKEATEGKGLGKVAPTRAEKMAILDTAMNPLLKGDAATLSKLAGEFDKNGDPAIGDLIRMRIGQPGLSTPEQVAQNLRSLAEEGKDARSESIGDALGIGAQRAARSDPSQREQMGELRESIKGALKEIKERTEGGRVEPQVAQPEVQSKEQGVPLRSQANESNSPFSNPDDLVADVRAAMGGHSPKSMTPEDSGTYQERKESLRQQEREDVFGKTVLKNIDEVNGANIGDRMRERMINGDIQASKEQLAEALKDPRTRADAMRMIRESSGQALRFRGNDLEGLLPEALEYLKNASPTEYERMIRDHVDKISKIQDEFRERLPQMEESYRQANQAIRESGANLNIPERSNGSARIIMVDPLVSPSLDSNNGFYNTDTDTIYISTAAPSSRWEVIHHHENNHRNNGNVITEKYAGNGEVRGLEYTKQGIYLFDDPEAKALKGLDEAAVEVLAQIQKAVGEGLPVPRNNQELEALLAGRNPSYRPFINSLLASGVPFQEFINAGNETNLDSAGRSEAIERLKELLNQGGSRDFVHQMNEAIKSGDPNALREFIKTVSIVPTETPQSPNSNDFLKNLLDKPVIVTQAPSPPDDLLNNLLKQSLTPKPTPENKSAGGAAVQQPESPAPEVNPLLAVKPDFVIPISGGEKLTDAEKAALADMVRKMAGITAENPFVAGTSGDLAFAIGIIDVPAPGINDISRVRLGPSNIGLEAPGIELGRVPGDVNNDPRWYLAPTIPGMIIEVDGLQYDRPTQIDKDKPITIRTPNGVTITITPYDDPGSMAGSRLKETLKALGKEAVEDIREDIGLPVTIKERLVNSIKETLRSANVAANKALDAANAIDPTSWSEEMWENVIIASISRAHERAGKREARRAEDRAARAEAAADYPGYDVNSVITVGEMTPLEQYEFDNQRHYQATGERIVGIPTELLSEQQLQALEDKLNNSPDSSVNNKSTVRMGLEKDLGRAKEAAGRALEKVAGAIENAFKPDPNAYIPPNIDFVPPVPTPALGGGEGDGNDPDGGTVVIPGGEGEESGSVPASSEGDKPATPSNETPPQTPTAEQPKNETPAPQSQPENRGKGKGGKQERNTSTAEPDKDPNSGRYSNFERYKNDPEYRAEQDRLAAEAAQARADAVEQSTGRASTPPPAEDTKKDTGPADGYDDYSPTSRRSVEERMIENNSRSRPTEYSASERAAIARQSREENDAARAADPNYNNTSRYAGNRTQGRATEDDFANAFKGLVED